MGAQMPRPRPTVPFIRPHFPDPADIAADIAAIVERNWYTNMGPLEHRLAGAMSDYLGGGTHVSLLANATLGLMLCLAHLRIPGRTKVLVPSFTFTAAPQSILWCGLQPVFVDIAADDWQPDVEQAAKWLEEHAGDTAAIMAANSFGVGGARIDEWEELAGHWAIPLILDSAAGFGSRYGDGNPLGGRAACEVFSLHTTKPFGIGEGGAVTSRSPELIAALDRAKNFGFTVDRDVSELGLNAKLPELQCAVGIRQLAGLEDRLAMRRAVLRGYHGALEGTGIVFQPNDLASTVPFLGALMPTAGSRRRAGQLLTDAGVEHRRYYEPVHQQSLFASVPGAGTLAVTEDFAERIISLPVHDEMSTAVVTMIASTVREATDAA